MKKRSLIKLNVVLFLFSLFIFSCSKDNPKPEKETPEVLPNEKEDEYLYAFDRYEIVSKKLYVGSKNGGVDRSEQFDPEQYFRTTYFDQSKLEYFKQDSLLIRKDTIIEYPLNYEANTFKFKIGEKDSLFRWNIYANLWQYYGKAPKDRQEIRYERNYSALVKIRKEGWSFGLDDRGEGFVDDKNFFWGNTYHFPTIKDMTEITDTLAYCNVSYVYKLVSK